MVLKICLSPCPSEHPFVCLSPLLCSYVQFVIYSKCSTLYNYGALTFACRRVEAGLKGLQQTFKILVIIATVLCVMIELQQLVRVRHRVAGWVKIGWIRIRPLIKKKRILLYQKVNIDRSAIIMKRKTDPNLVFISLHLMIKLWKIKLIL